MYLIYRINNAPDLIKFEDKISLFAWSDDKKITKAFFKQRNKSKYRVVKTTLDEVSRTCGEVPDDDMKLDFVSLNSKSGKKLTIITTKEELNEFEARIRDLFQEYSSLTNFPGKGNYLELAANMKEKYSEALSFIGFKPIELDALFQTYYDETYSAFDKVIYSAEGFIKVMINYM